MDTDDVIDLTEAFLQPSFGKRRSPSSDLEVVEPVAAASGTALNAAAAAETMEEDEDVLLTGEIGQVCNKSWWPGQATPCIAMRQGCCVVSSGTCLAHEAATRQVSDMGARLLTCFRSNDMVSLGPMCSTQELLLPCSRLGTATCRTRETSAACTGTSAGPVAQAMPHTAPRLGYKLPFLAASSSLHTFGSGVALHAQQLRLHQFLLSCCSATASSAMLRRASARSGALVRLQSRFYLAPAIAEDLSRRPPGCRAQQRRADRHPQGHAYLTADRSLHLLAVHLALIQIQTSWPRLEGRGRGACSQRCACTFLSVLQAPRCWTTATPMIRPSMST